MKFKIICAVIAFAIPISLKPAAATEYDPINTMSAINMAIVSVHRIASSRDRVVLDAEYKNIIDNLSLGNIEDDQELIELYKELMSTIGGKALRQDEAARIKARYTARGKENFVDRLAGARFVSGNPWSFVGVLLSGEAAQYFGAATLFSSRERDGENDELWRLERENLEDLASLQRRLLDSSWTLLRKYGLPDEYRLASGDLDALDKAIFESDPERSLRMFKALEPNFKMYAPFWYYYSAAASRAGDAQSASHCLDEFDRAWRPVLRRDPFKAEAAKLRAGELSRMGAPKASIEEQLKIVLENSTRENWVNNLFAGVMYYSIGETEGAIECVQLNLDFDAEREISGEIINNMRAGNLDVELFYAFIGDMYLNGRGVERNLAKAVEMYIAPADAGNSHAQMMLGGIFETGDGVKNEEKAAIYYAKAAENGIVEAAIRLGDMCRDGRGVDGRRLEDAYMWYYLAQLQDDARGKARIDELEGRGLLTFRSVNAATGRRARERALLIFEGL